jgi:hypothetical protein
MASRLSKLTSRHGEWVTDAEHKIEVYHVRSPHLLIQAAGYLKHITGKDGLYGIHFRGQATLYGNSLKPTLYRVTKTKGNAAKQNGALYAYIKECQQKSEVLKHLPEYAWEAVLQHYGIKTRWVDVVDNVWVALWFACQRAHATGNQGEFLHFEQRQPQGDSDFAYILLIKADHTPSIHQPGFYSGKNTELVDLRVAAPSMFLRPHAQTGLLVRQKGEVGGAIIDYKDLVAGIVRVSLHDALSWLGQGKLLSTHVLFPPPVYDFGYRDLLNFAPKPPKDLGAIHHVGA